MIIYTDLAVKVHTVCAMTYTVVHMKHILFTIGTGKKNDSAKSIFHKSSNKWNGARDILEYEYKLNMLRYFERKIGPYRYAQK